MSRRGKKGPWPLIPVWLGAPHILPESEVTVAGDHTNFRLRGQIVIMGEKGLLLLTALPLRPGSAVHVEVRTAGLRMSGSAIVEQAVTEQGTVFRFPPWNGWFGKLLEKLRGEEII